jgi:hypothetical protein
MTPDERLRGELEALESSVPESRVPLRFDRGRPTWMRSAIAVTSILFIATLAVYLMADLVVSTRPTASNAVTAPSAGSVTAETRQGDFTLRVFSPRATWWSDEAIELTAALGYEGASEGTTIWSPTAITFDVDEISHGRYLDPGMFPICQERTIMKGHPIVQPYFGFSDDPFQLPAGRWTITTRGRVGLDTCGGEVLDMRVSIVIEVTEGPTPSGLVRATPDGITEVHCRLSTTDCDLALSSLQLLTGERADPRSVVVVWGRGLAWHAEVHACWEDGHYMLIDVLGPGDEVPPDRADLTWSVRENPWDVAPCN